MLTNNDIQKIIVAFKEIFPTKEEVASKAELSELKESFDMLQTSMDKVIVRFDIFQQEMLAVNHRVAKLE